MPRRGTIAYNRRALPHPRAIYRVPGIPDLCRHCPAAKGVASPLPHFPSLSLCWLLLSSPIRRKPHLILSVWFSCRRRRCNSGSMLVELLCFRLCDAKFRKRTRWEFNAEEYRRALTFSRGRGSKELAYGSRIFRVRSNIRVSSNIAILFVLLLSRFIIDYLDLMLWPDLQA